MNILATKIRWGAEKRLEFIEFRSYWEGGVNRSDLTKRFGISVPQASSDLSNYQKIAPDNLVYDSSEKRYVATPEFKPQLISLSAENYLSQMRLNLANPSENIDTWIDRLPPMDTIPVLNRNVKPTILREILATINNSGSIEILYQSMNSKHPDLVWRRITPHALGSDGMRWHIRAFCHNDNKFKDFLLSRCQSTRNFGAAGHTAEHDIHWSEKFEVVLQPNPELSKSQREGIESDYSMENGKLVLSIRRALLFYLNKQLRLDLIKYDQTPFNNPIVVTNRAEFDEAIKQASFN